VRFGVFPVEFSGVPAIHGEGVGLRVIGSEWIKEFFWGGMEARFGC